MSHYCQKTCFSTAKRYMKDPKVSFFVYKKLGDVLDKLKVRCFNATSLSTVLPGFK